ncbi:MAG: redoxin domain-containing protein [Nitrospinae bacterium]|nr:redoxin domain-containing protein [Nitrospinota bacterium]
MQSQNSRGGRPQKAADREGSQDGYEPQIRGADFSFICPTEVAGFQKCYAAFASCSCEVLGVSVDPLEAHRAWAMVVILIVYELPVGLGVITALLFAIAGINLLTKEVATVSGVAFTLIFFTIFSLSERVSERRRGTMPPELEQFRLSRQAEVSDQTLNVRPGNILCPVRDYNNLAHVTHVLQWTDTDRQDIVVMTVRVLRGPATGYQDIHAHELFTVYEPRLFSRVVALAETAGKHVELLVVPSSGVFQAMAHTAVQLKSGEIIAGRSAVLTPDEQARLMGRGWEGVPGKPQQQVRFHVIDLDGTTHVFVLGAHNPQLTAEDIDLIHRLWLDVTSQPGYEHLHHRDIVHVALTRFVAELTGSGREELLAALARVCGV